MHFIHNYTRTLSAFPRGRRQHVRHMRSSIASMIQSDIKTILTNSNCNLFLGLELTRRSKDRKSGYRKVRKICCYCF